MLGSPSHQAQNQRALPTQPSIVFSRHSSLISCLRSGRRDREPVQAVCHRTARAKTLDWFSRCDLTSALGHVWTAPWQELADVGAESIGCGQVSGLSMRQVWPLALPQSGRRPQHHEQASTPTHARSALHPAADIERCVAGFCLSFDFRFSKNFLDGSVAESASDIRRHSATGNFQC